MRLFDMQKAYDFYHMSDISNMSKKYLKYRRIIWEIKIFLWL